MKNNLKKKSGFSFEKPGQLKHNQKVSKPKPNLKLLKLIRSVHEKHKPTRPESDSQR